mmetsp:Transcript_2975/g.5240  ORF Transcript_2975/g.5240 Transcript_2975/m.5240 type:complete len:144 (+) Transcript_2975:114-545(+)
MRVLYLFGLFIVLIHVGVLIGCVNGEDKVDINVEYLPSDCNSFAKKGDKLQVHYVLTLESNGNKIDSSVDRGSPFEFTLGRGQVIKGWEIGIEGMCPGEKRQLKIPPSLGYGSRSTGRIPPHSTLVFATELIKIVSSADNSEL